jgi:hypothetical protein
MNGKPDKAVHIVDKEKEKTRAINRRISKKVFGKRGREEWGFVPKFYIDGFKMISNVLLIPVVLAAAILEGIRAGFIAALQKALALYRM